MLMKLNGQPFDVNLVQIYAPTTESTQEELEEFYAYIKESQKHMKNNDVNIIMWSRNSKVRAENVNGVVGLYGL